MFGISSLDEFLVVFCSCINYRSTEIAIIPIHCLIAQKVQTDLHSGPANETTIILRHIIMMSEPVCLILDTLQLHSVLNTSGNSISQIYNINWRHLAIKSAIRQYGFSLTKSREASPFDCPRLPKATTTTDVQRGGAESPTGVSYSEHMKPIFK